MVTHALAPDGAIMSKIFLKSAKVRDFTVFDVSNLTEEECHEEFQKYRWGDSGKQICSSCGVIDFHYYRLKRKQWRCKSCDSYFSVTTGTVFQDRKLPFKKLLMFMMLFLTSAAGTSVHEHARLLGIQIKTGHVNLGKLRELIVKSADKSKMNGLVQMDGGYFGGRPRKGNFHGKVDPVAVADYVESKLRGDTKKSRKPTSPTAYKNWKRRENRRIVMVLRQCYPQKGMGGSYRTIIAICRSENEKDATQLAYTYINPGTEIMTDSCSAYNLLSKDYDHKSVEHAELFSENGVNDNQAESYYSRMRRHVKGVSLRCTPKYIHDLANEMAWREDQRRSTLLERLKDLMHKLYHYGRSQWWRGYFQGYMRNYEILWESSRDNPFR